MQAKRKPLFFKNFSYNNLLTFTPAPLLTPEEITLLHPCMSLDENEEAVNVACPIKNFLEPDLSCRSENENGFTYFATNENEKETFFEKENEREFQKNGDVLMDKYMVPWSLIERWGSAMGILMVILLK